MASSVALYWAGMAFNDYADATVDAVERPERPIPSGRVARRTALATACGLTAAALGLSALAGGRRALGVALPLTGLVWAYDLRLKSTQRTGRSGARTQGLRTAGRPADRRAHLHRHSAQPPRDPRAPRTLPAATLAGSTATALAAAALPGLRRSTRSRGARYTGCGSCPWPGEQFANYLCTKVIWP